MKFKSAILIVSSIISCCLDCTYGDVIQPNQVIDAPDKLHSFSIKVYDRDYHFVLEDLITHKKTTFLDENIPIFCVKWTQDSKSIFIAGHYARGKFLRVIRRDGTEWKLDEIDPPEKNIDEYEVLNWEFNKDRVKLFFKFTLLDENYHPTGAYKCSLDYDPSTGGISNYKKESISFDTYGSIKSALAPN
jgi:hypothetical protein